MTELYAFAVFAVVILAVWRLRVWKLGQLRAREDGRAVAPMSAADRTALAGMVFFVSAALVRFIIRALRAP